LTSHEQLITCVQRCDELSRLVPHHTSGEGGVLVTLSAEAVVCDREITKGSATRRNSLLWFPNQTTDDVHLIDITHLFFSLPFMGIWLQNCEPLSVHSFFRYKFQDLNPEKSFACLPHPVLDFKPSIAVDTPRFLV
jgi:hypothetical protein